MKDEMMLIDIKRAIKSNGTVKFSFYRSGELWYETEFGEIFPVPIEDTGEAMFLATDKAILFMRYMRKYNKKLQEENGVNTGT
tara:strand:- start:951 stop:1199 length:249 start_codon:yes stop_codon:yes gene_type:complete